MGLFTSIVRDANRQQSPFKAVPFTAVPSPSEPLLSKPEIIHDEPADQQQAVQHPPAEPQPPNLVAAPTPFEKAVIETPAESTEQTARKPEQETVVQLINDSQADTSDSPHQDSPTRGPQQVAPISVEPVLTILQPQILSMIESKPGRLTPANEPADIAIPFADSARVQNEPEPSQAVQLSPLFEEPPPQAVQLTIMRPENMAPPLQPKDLEEANQDLRAKPRPLTEGAKAPSPPQVQRVEVHGPQPLSPAPESAASPPFVQPQKIEPQLPKVHIGSIEITLVPSPKKTSSINAQSRNQGLNWSRSYLRSL